MKIEVMATPMEMENKDNQALEKTTNNENDDAALGIVGSGIDKLMRMLKSSGGGGGGSKASGGSTTSGGSKISDTNTNPTTQTSNPTTSKTTCNKNLVCSGMENCRNCKSDCRTYNRVCGDGKCVEGENCKNCPSDCAGNSDAAAGDVFCCGFDDGIKPDGCGDSRCENDGYECVETTCEGLNTRSSALRMMNMGVGCFFTLVAGISLYLFSC